MLEKLFIFLLFFSNTLGSDASVLFSISFFQPTPPPPPPPPPPALKKKKKTMSFARTLTRFCLLQVSNNPFGLSVWVSGLTYRIIYANSTRNEERRKH